MSSDPIQHGCDSRDFDFRHHLYDVIVLLGGRRDVAEMLKKSKDLAVTASDLETLRQYIIDLQEALKSRLAAINLMRISPAGEANHEDRDG